MITQGLSHHEITLITKILDEHGIQYQVGATGGEEGAKAKGGRGDASFYAIEIPQPEYDKLPASAKAKLENLGIYPEMEAPDFTDEPKPERPAEEVAAMKKRHKNVEYIVIGAMLLGLLMFIRKVMLEQ